MADAALFSEGPMLRRIAGVDETLLAEVPTERFRYSRLGGVIVGTAVIATISMWLALCEIAGHTTLLLAPIALLWGLFIGNLDAWIVSSLHGTRWRKHPWVVVPRILLAVIFGFIIAEPLVLRAFAPAIENDVRSLRSSELRSLETRLRACNPATGGNAPATVDCSNARIVVSTPSPLSIAAQIAALSKQRTELNGAVGHGESQLKELERTARLECNGTHGSGLTGEFGDGINCERDRNQADQYRSENHLSGESSELLRVAQELRRLTPTLRIGTKRYEAALSAAIAAKVAQRRKDQGHNIGLLERMYSLRRLVARNWYLSVAEWFLRLFFVTIDCLPVIVKVTGGTTAYDYLVNRRLEAREAMFASSEETKIKTVTSKNQVVRYELDRRAQDEIDRIDSELRLENARRNLEVNAAIDQFTEDLLREQRAAANARRKRFVDEPSTPTGVAGHES